MKKLLIITVLAGMTLGAKAQEKAQRTPQERAQLRTDRMAKELALTPEQAAKVQAINLKYADQVEEMRAEREAQRQAAMKDGKGRAMRDAHDAEVKAVLTPEQYTQWTAKKEAMKERRTEKRREMKGDQRAK